MGCLCSSPSLCCRDDLTCADKVLQCIIPRSFLGGINQDTYVAVRRRVNGAIEQEFEKCAASFDVVEERIDGVTFLFLVSGARTSAEKRPLVLWLHGGGFVLGSARDDWGAKLYQNVCQIVDCIFVSIDYALAPERPFPMAFNEVARGLEILSGNEELSQRINYDQGRLHVAGCSAGAGLAGSLVAEALRRGIACSSMLLFFPFVSPKNAEDFFDSESKEDTSYRRSGHLSLVPAEFLRWSWRAYLAPEFAVPSSETRAPSEAIDLAHVDYTYSQQAAGSASDSLKIDIERAMNDARVTPLCPTAWDHGVPRTLVVTGLADPLLDEGRDLVRLLREAGAKHGGSEITLVEATCSHATLEFDKRTHKEVVGIVADMIASDRG